jgi:hypothetical protein
MFVMVGVPIVLVALICGGIVVANLTKPKPGVKAPANTENKEKVVNPASIGGKLEEFVKKFGSGDSVAVVATEGMNYKYTGFDIGENTVLVVGYDDDEFVTCGVLFKHDGNKRFKVLQLDSMEIERGLKMFSRHEGINWQGPWHESTSDGEELRTWGYSLFEESFKWGSSSVLMGAYSSQSHYLLIFSSNSGSASLEKLTNDMRHWQVYARNQSESN